MYIPFNVLPDTARLWVYGAERPFSEEEIHFIHSTAKEFLGTWSTHGTPLAASYQLIGDRFLVLAVDEGVKSASGCSIDSSVAYVRLLEKELNLNLTDRSLVYFLVDDQVKVLALAPLKEAIAQGSITPSTTLINTLVTTKDELEQNWLLPAGESWLKRYFKKVSA